MRLESEIKQKHFENVHEKLAVNLHFTSNWLGMKYQKLLKPHGISHQQFNVLRILKGRFPNPATILLIKERMLDKNSNASRLVDKLVMSGLVHRKQCPLDRRQVDITITEKGMDLLDILVPKIRKLTEDLLRIPEEVALRLSDTLDEIRN